MNNLLADSIRRRRGLPALNLDPGVDPPEAPEAPPRVVEVPLSPDDAAAEQAAKGAPPVAPPAAAPPAEYTGDDGLADAQEADRKSRLTAGMELAARQLVGGITRTDVPQGLGPAPSGVPAAMERAKTRRQQVVDALNRSRQGALDKSTLALQAAETAKALRPPQEKGPQIDYTQSKEEQAQLGRDKLEETMRANRAREQALADKANKPRAAPKPAEDIPPGYAISAGSNPGKETRKKFSSLVSSAERMKGLTGMMREALKGTTGLSRTMDPKTITGLKQIATMMQIEGKNVAGLGALSGPDMGLMNAIASDPTSVKTNLSVDLPRMLDTLDAWGDASVAGDSKATGIVKAVKQTAPSGPKPSPGSGYERGTVKGVPGWYNKSTHDFQAD